MVLIHVKKSTVDQFLYETDISVSNQQLIGDIVKIYNGRLKVERICGEIEQLIEYGTALPLEMIGLTDEQIEELKLIDYWGNSCIPTGDGFGHPNKDPCGKRNGKRPNTKMCKVLQKVVTEARNLISKLLIQQNRTLTMTRIQEAVELLRGAVTIVYPMKLPPHDPIRMEFENIEDLAGTHASLDVIDPTIAQLWFSNRELYKDDNLIDYLGSFVEINENQELKSIFETGKNNKCKVIMKLSKRGHGPPAREPIISEEEHKQMMLHAFRKQEELKHLNEQERFQDHYLDSEWADNQVLKRSCQGLNNINWKAF